MRPTDDSFAERQLPLQRFVSGVEFRVLGQRLELSVIAFAPFDLAAQLFVADTLDALITDILTPKFHHAFDLAQHVGRRSPLGLLSLAQSDVLINHAVDAAACEWKP